MLLFYIRHGDPIYMPDSLTPLEKDRPKPSQNGFRAMDSIKSLFPAQRAPYRPPSQPVRY